MRISWNFQKMFQLKTPVNFKAFQLRPNLAIQIPRKISLINYDSRLVS